MNKTKLILSQRYEDKALNIFVTLLEVYGDTALIRDDRNVLHIVSIDEFESYYELV